MAYDVPSAVGREPKHERLQAWLACHEVTLAVYRASREWPDDERQGLALQSRRAALGAAASIAGGAARRGARDFRHHLELARAHLAELGYLLRLARELGYLPGERWGEVEALRDHAGCLTGGLYHALGKQMAPGR